MSFDFPTAPLLNDEAVFAPTGATWTWDGQKWRSKRGREVFDPEPLIASISPTQVNQNVAFALTVGGTYFETTSVITLDGVDAVTTFVSEVQLTSDVAAQPYGKPSLAVNVRDAALARGANADMIITLVDPRVPLITAISPTSTNQGVAFTLTVTGTGFIDGTQVTLNGTTIATTYVSATSLTAQVPAQTYGPGTTKTVNVTGPNPGTNPNLTLTIVDSRPVVTSITPVAGVQNEALTLTATGTFFRADTPITVGGTAIPTTFVSATQLTASYTCPYFNPTELGQVDKAVGVAGSLSATTNVNFVDPRFKIRSTYPDYYSEWTPNVNHIEVWGWGVMAADSVVYIDRMGGAGPEPRSTWIDPNIVGSELILVFDINPAPEYDATTKLTVLNKGIHWSAGSWDFWCEDIG